MQNAVTVLLMLVVVAVIFLTVFIWAWAVRRPAAHITQAEATTPLEPTPVIYAAIGASDVVGIGSNDPATQSWVSVLHGFMPKDTRFVRLGRGGITLHEANQVEVPAAIAAKPDVITLWNCVNDATQGVSLASYRQELNTALSRLTNETDAGIVLLNLPDITILMQDLDEPQSELIRGGIAQWNSAIASIAARYGDRVKLVDLYPLSDEILQHPEYISTDHFHPSATGYDRLARVVWQAVKPLLAHETGRATNGK